MAGAAYKLDVDEIAERLARRVVRRKGGRARAERQMSSLSGASGAGDNVTVIENRFGERITRVEGTIDPGMRVERGDRFLFISYDQSALTHGLHKYPAKFFPELPRWLIQRYSRPGELVLDPFSGSGTTNLEALLARRHSVGVDVDPFSRFIAGVKTTPIDGKVLQRCSRTLLEKVVDFKPGEVRRSEVPDFPYRDTWFNPEIVLELAHIKKTINGLRSDQGIKDFFLVCMSSIIRSISNADDHCTRTVVRKRLNKIVEPSDALRRFVETVLLAVPKMTAFSKACPDGVGVSFPKDMDARAIGFADGTFDLAVTSPPYANAVDYPRTHQLEIYWLGLAEGSLSPLKKRHVGTEVVSASEYRSLRETGIPEADSALARIFAKDPRRFYIAYKYLVDMESNLAEVRRVLKRGARYAVVVGNNRIRGEFFESWKYIMSMGERIGFEIETMFGSEIIKHFIKVPRQERINTDWVVVFRK